MSFVLSNYKKLIFFPFVDRIAMLASTVSSKMLARMAEVEGFRFDETLTGFKWLGNRALELKQKEGLEVVFAYEEAIGKRLFGS